MKRATRATTTTIAAVGRKRGGRSKEKGERGKESRDMLFPIHHRVLTRERIGEGKKRKREGKQNLRESKRSREATRGLANKPSKSNTSYRRGGLRSEEPKLEE